jgi:hypothetical protein
MAVSARHRFRLRRMPGRDAHLRGLATAIREISELGLAETRGKEGDSKRPPPVQKSKQGWGVEGGFRRWLRVK